MASVAGGLHCALLPGDGSSPSVVAPSEVPETGPSNDFLVVDCLLPGRVKKLGGQLTYMTPRRPIKTTARDCEIRGGEYVAYDRASYATALKIWLPLAEQGDARAQTYVGEIHEKGLGIAPDFAAAARWYRKAAEQGYAPAQISLGQLYETGRGVERDPAQALAWYRRASGLDEAGLEFVTAVAGVSGVGVRVEAPTIQIVSPDVPPTRGSAQVAVPAGVETLPLVGRVQAPAGLASLTVNGEPTETDERGVFRRELELSGVGGRVEVVAVDDLGQRRVRAFEIGEAEAARAQAVLRDADFGAFYALVIGIDDYRELEPLDAAVRDARDIAQVLSEEYGYQATLLEDPTRYQILFHLDALRKSLGESDNLLLYFAGHGQIDSAGEGYWQPADAVPGDPGSWVANRQVAEILGAMEARHVMVVADSCYSGALSDASFAVSPDGERDRERWEDEMLKRRSRTALTSGGDEPVADGSGPHSAFAAAFLRELEQNEVVLEAAELFQRVRRAVELESAQRPRYAPIVSAGHEDGEFLFVSAPNVAAAPPL